jgi:arginyl-tRNA synthetase
MKEIIKKMLEKAILQAKESNNWCDFQMPEIGLDYAKNEQFGDYASNVAMILAKKVGENPMEIANEIVKLLNSQIAKNIDLEKIETVAPGYINFYLSKKYLQAVVEKINSEKEDFGQLKTGKGMRINNEFISANPTGPLHLGNGRGGFYGDSLSKVLRKAGYEVTNEYYVNDAGEQTIKLAHSFKKDKEAVYSGEYIDEMRNRYAELLNEPVEASSVSVSAVVLFDYIKPTVKDKMKINFDGWISEKKDIIEAGYANKAIDILRNKELTYEKDGALWLKTTDFGDDKDRVLTKSDGQKTYFASDCGYILNKIERGFDKIIEIWGADHHGYINRFQAVAIALGLKKEQTQFIIVQLVRLVKDGKEVRMSKRAGNVVYIDDLIDEVGHDATRFFFLMYSPDTHMNFDLGLAKERSAKNPVFYVQYAHARICSILTKVKSQKSKVKSFDLSLLMHEKELSLIKELNKFPELVEEIAKNYEVHKLSHYAIKLADKFHSFYDKCRVIDEGDLELTSARLAMANAVRIVLAETLRLIGVDAPKSM